LYVILCFGYGEKYKTIGMSCNVSIEKAIYKAQKECIQCFSFSVTKYYYKEVKIKEDKSAIEDVYHKYFENISIEDFKQIFDYLKKSETILLDEISQNIKTINDCIQDLYNSLSMETFVVTIPNNRNIPHMKICKVFSPKWFPHMYPKHFKEEDYTNVEDILNVKLDRNIEILPFP